ncbi:MAG: site-specific DNA-methyltransferase [Alphaproteobacteria bacterium]|nr:site-specific DNA-methyltransferase [Alphaproteobacteria bacterium]
MVLDCFAGSGSPLIAAAKTGRSAQLMELDPKYCDVIVRRWPEFTGRDVIHEEEKLTFANTYKKCANLPFNFRLKIIPCLQLYTMVYNFPSVGNSH